MNSSAKQIAVSGLIALVFIGVAYTTPRYFTNTTYLGGLLLLEVLVASIWLYRSVFFALVIVTFLLAGMGLPGNSTWTIARWVVLGLGALIGAFVMLRERRYPFGVFHILGLFAVLSAFVSAAVSRYTSLSLLKALSLCLLFLYGGTGARLAASNPDSRFFERLLSGCEIFVGGVFCFFVLGMEIMGNPNSLGAVMGVAAAPILLWGTLLQQSHMLRVRRVLSYTIAIYLIYESHSRAGILAAFLSCALLCVALRRYAVFALGVGALAVLVASAAIFQPEASSTALSSFTSDVIYKSKNPAEGLLSSRRSPWQDTLDTIRVHFWFGTGFGTSDNGQDLSENIGRFASTSAISTEHGSSYLTILAWMGVLGVLPFFLLLLSLCAKSFQTIVWMHRTADPLHPAFPIAIVMIAGLIHAVFEDWLFAPGYYLCVFYWCMAFIFVDHIQSPQFVGTNVTKWFAPRSRQDHVGFGSIR